MARYRKCLLMLAAIFCQVALVQAAEDMDALAAARTLWRKSAPDSYSYVIQTSSTAISSCTPRRALVEVRAGSISRVVVRGEGLVERELPSSCFDAILTVDRLFDYIAGYLMEDDPGRGIGIPCVRTAYDAQRGFPTFIEDECELDGDTPITVRDFAVLDSRETVVLARYELELRDGDVKSTFKSQAFMENGRTTFGFTPHFVELRLSPVSESEYDVRITVAPDRHATAGIRLDRTFRGSYGVPLELTAEAKALRVTGTIAILRTRDTDAVLAQGRR